MRQASSSEIQRARFLEGGVGLVSGCDWMIIDVSWNFTWKFSWLKCFLLGHKCYRLYYIDDLSLMTGKIEDLQKALDIIEQFCFSFGFNIKKTEICVFGTRRASAPDVQVYYRGQLIKVVDSIKYLGLNFT